MSAVGEHNFGLLAERGFERRGDYSALLFEGRWHRSGEAVRALAADRRRPHRAGRSPRRPGLDDDGYLFIVDRKEGPDHPRRLQRLPTGRRGRAMEHPAVQMAGVVGRPDQLHGEEVVAYVALHAGAELSAPELIAWARERIGDYKYPREVEVVAAIPMTAVGKIDRKALRVRPGEHGNRRYLTLITTQRSSASWRHGSNQRSSM